MTYRNIPGNVLAMEPRLEHLRRYVGETAPGVPADLVTVEVPIIDTRWTSALRLALQDGHLVVAEVRVFPNEPNRKQAGLWSYQEIGVGAKVPRGGLKTKLLRKVKLGAYAKSARQVVESLTKRLAEYLEQAPAAVVPEVYRALRLPAAPPARRRGRPDKFYAHLADQYARACEHRSRRPVADLAERYGVPQPQMRDMLHEARERGLLTKGDPGRSGGELTPLALTMLVRHPRKARPRRRTRR